jgi:erythritol transport system ATP-binding protein
MTVRLHAAGISKQYGATLALEGVDFDVHAGAVNVLIGENGAGKSTLMKILAGVETPTSGQLTLDGKPVRFNAVADAARYGISIVHQELNLCANLSVTENIFLARHLTTAGVIDRAAERSAAAALMKRFEQAIDPDTLVGALRIGQQQIVEIARALADDARILILDEPTSALSQAEVSVLFRIIADLKASGVAVVYISHRLEELMAIGDYVTVLRDGRLQASAPIAEASIPWIIRHMLGREGEETGQSAAAEPGPAVLTVTGLDLVRPQGGWQLKDIDLTVHKGQITAIYGLLGAGRSELFETLLGGGRPSNGTITLNGRDITHLSVAARVDKGLVLVPEDRQAEGLFPNFSVGDNLSLSSLGKFSGFGLIDLKACLAAVNEMMTRLGVKAASTDAPIGSLSGGNQQKVVIGRCLLPGPAVLLIDEPGRGVDVGARHDIFARMRDLAAEGMAIVFATSDMSEALHHSDRILVMAGGRITADLSPQAASEALLVKAANAVSLTVSEEA